MGNCIEGVGLVFAKGSALVIGDMMIPCYGCDAYLIWQHGTKRCTSHMAVGINAVTGSAAELQTEELEYEPRGRLDE